MLGISVRSNIDEFARQLTAQAQRQLQFAAAQAINALAKDVIDAERKNMATVLDRPTPFTLGSVRRLPATKANLRATVFVMDTAAKYLEPYEEGGLHTLIGRGKTWFNPKNSTPLNQYGNLTKRQLDQLRSRPDIYVGTLTFKSGEKIGGVWQRPAPKGKRKGMKRGRIAANNTGHVKLLVRFGDAIEVKQHLDYQGVARRTVQANFNRRMTEAINRAMATAR